MFIKTILAAFVSLAGLLLATPVDPGANTAPASAAAAPKTSASTAPVSEAEWKAMLARVKAGGVIDLGTRPVAFVGDAFQPTAPVTIRGGVFGPVELYHWHNVTFDGATFQAPEGAVEYLTLFDAHEPEKLTIRNSHFIGVRADDGVLHVRGFLIRNGRGVTVERSTFEQMSGFLSFIRTTGLHFADNEVRNIREGIEIQGGGDILIERNRFEDFRPAQGDHADAIQIFTTGLNAPDDLAAHDVTIRDNLILAAGKAQAVFATDDTGLWAQGRGYKGFTIENNIIVGAAWHGITALPMTNLTIRNNKLLKNADVDTMDSRITASGNGVVLEGNDANDFILTGPVSESKNRKVGGSKPAQIDALIADWVARFRKS